MVLSIDLSIAKQIGAKKRIVLLVCTIVLFAAANSSSPPHSKGTVHVMGGDPVKREEVAIESGGKYTTDDYGEFEFDLGGSLKVGKPARFHVNHVNLEIKVDKWIIIKPCDLVNGRTDSLPDPDAEPIAIIVLKKGDSRLKSYSVVECTIETAAARFPSDSGDSSLAPQAASTKAIGGNGSSLDSSGVVAKYLGVPQVVDIARRIDDEKPDSQQRVSPIMDQRLLAEVASELGLTTEEVSSAIGDWAKAVTADYEKGLAAFYSGDYVAASRYISKSIPPQPGKFLKRYVPLARAEYELGHYANAEADLRKVLSVQGDDPLILNDLGLVLDAEGKYSEAESSYKLALALNENSPVTNDLAVATNLSNLGGLYTFLGRYQEAEPFLEGALEIEERYPESLSLAITLNNFGLYCKTLGKYDEAERLYKRALEIDGRVSVPHNPTRATHLNNLAALYDARGNYDKALSLYQEALDIDQAVLPPDHPDIANRLNNLGVLHQHQGDYDGAVPLLTKAIDIDKKSLGEDHPDLSRDLNNLAISYRHEQRYSEAEELFNQALTIDEKTLGPCQFRVGNHLNNLALVYGDEGKYTEAETILKLALSIKKKTVGPDDPDIALTAMDLASVLHQLHRDDEANAYKEQAFEILSKWKKNHNKLPPLK